MIFWTTSWGLPVLTLGCVCGLGMVCWCAYQKKDFSAHSEILLESRCSSGYRTPGFCRDGSRVLNGLQVRVIHLWARLCIKSCLLTVHRSYDVSKEINRFLSEIVPIQFFPVPFGYSLSYRCLDWRPHSACRHSAEQQVIPWDSTEQRLTAAPQTWANVSYNWFLFKSWSLSHSYREA